MVGLLHATAFMMLLLVGWVIWNSKPSSINQRDGLRWVQLCRCCSAGVQQQPKQYDAEVGYYLRCREERVSYIPCSNAKWLFCIFLFFMFRPQSETVRRTRLSVQTESEQAFFRRPFLRPFTNVVSSASLNRATQTSW